MESTWTHTALARYLDGARNGHDRPIANNTRALRAPDDAVAIRLHDTDIAILRPDGSVTLDSGGWRTVTTKDRIASVLAYHPARPEMTGAYQPYQPRTIGWRIGSDRGVWYLYPLDWNRAGRVPFFDGVTIGADGAIINLADAPDDPAVADCAMLARIGAYARAYARAYAAGMPAPGAGDCFGCAYGVFGADHLDSHMVASYFVPSLWYRALDYAGAGPAWYWTDGASMGGSRAIGRGMVGRWVRRYMVAQLLPHRAGRRAIAR